MVLLDNAPDLTQNVISLSLAELIKTKAPKEATPDENTDAAEKVKADALEPEKEPKKTTIVKRAPKKAKEPEKKAATGKTTTKRGNTTEKKVKPANEPKKPKNESRKKMLNDDPEI